MNTKNTTYAELKHLPSKKQMGKEKQVIYSEVKTSTSNSNQTKITRPKSPKGKVSSVPFTWRLTVVILGILCFFLLLTTGILGYKGNKYGTCEGKWSCCGEKCYYFSNEEKNFEESKKSCKKMDSTLLKTNDEKELKFIQGQLSYFSWIGLSREGTSRSWKWEDGSRPNPKMISNWQESKNGNCAMMATRKMVPSDCSRYFHYVCEK